MKDFDPNEIAGIEHIRETFKETCARFGYPMVEPSPIESLAVLEAKSGPAIREDVYHFKDKAERDVALRFDLTIGMTRAVSAQKSVRLPLRRASFGGVWRYDEPQRGRYRYFHQWDIEVYGAQGAVADAEVIEFTVSMLGSLGLRNITVEISHRSIAESYIRNIIHEPGALKDMLRAVDKSKKKSEKEIINEYTAKGYSREDLGAVMRLAHARGSADEAKNALGGDITDGWDELRAVLESLEHRKVENVDVNLGIVRGLDYYSGTVFEVFDADSGIGALVGGGRYDSLSESLGGQPVAAAGAAGGVERILLAMESQKISAPEPVRHIVVAYANESMVSHAVSIASGLRAGGVAATVDPANHTLKKQLSDAASDNARTIIIVAPREFGEGTVLVRDMDSRAERTLAIDELLADPSAALS